MEKLNRVQIYLNSFGYPRSIVNQYKTGSDNYREEVKINGEEKRLQNNSKKC